MLLLIKNLGGYMRSSKIYRAAREYLGLRREDVCAILGWEMEDLIAIEEGYIPSLDMQGQLYRLYGLSDRDFVDVNDYPFPAADLSARDTREVVKMFLFAEEYKGSKAK